MAAMANLQLICTNCLISMAGLLCTSIIYATCVAAFSYARGVRLAGERVASRCAQVPIRACLAARQALMQRSLPAGGCPAGALRSPPRYDSSLRV